MELLLFDLASLLRRGSARSVVRSPHPVHSVLFRVVVFANASRTMFLLQVEFRGRILLVVYVGAIAVLFRFVVMMLNLSETGGVSSSDTHLQRGQIFVGATRRFASFLAWVYTRSSDSRVPKAPSSLSYLEWIKLLDSFTGIQAFGQHLYTEGRRYVLSAGMVLLVAMIGSIVLTFKVRTFAMAKRQQIDQQRSRDADRAILYVKNR